MKCGKQAACVQGGLQSLHRFIDNRRQKQYRLPVLVRVPSSVGTLRNGDVIELAVCIDHANKDDTRMSVSFSTRHTEDCCVPDVNHAVTRTREGTVVFTRTTVHETTCGTQSPM
jgi:hypothetical protein